MSKADEKRDREIINELHYCVNEFFNRFDEGDTSIKEDSEFVKSIALLTKEE
jgi:hypothetical protein